jgi:hypothetical protein
MLATTRVPTQWTDSKAIYHKINYEPQHSQEHISSAAQALQDSASLWHMLVSAAADIDLPLWFNLHRTLDWNTQKNVAAYFHAATVQ